MIKKITLSLILLLGILICCNSVFAADSLNVTDFNYEALSVTISGNIGNGGIKTGSVFIIPENVSIDSLSDSNLPVFAGIVTTDEEGAFSLPVSFFESGTAFGYGNYDVYLFSNAFSEEKKASFAYLSPAQILENKQNAIFNEFKNSQTWNALKAAVLGEDVEGNIINDNFSYINPDMTNYNALKNKNNQFIKMYQRKDEVQNFFGIASLFESIANELKLDEEKGDGKKPGSSTPSRPSASPSAPVMSITPSGSSSSNPNGASSKAFSDMDGHWAEDYASLLAKQGIINGYEDGSFRPDNPVTRAELSKIITEAFDIKGASQSQFSDVLSGDWFEPYVSAAASAGIVNGYDGKFDPNSNVARQDAALMIYRAISLTHKLGIGYTFFADETSIAEYAAQEISALAEIGIVTGNENNEFNPHGSLTRGEAAALVLRAADYISAH